MPKRPKAKAPRRVGGWRGARRIDEAMMRRAIAEARRGRPSPNPRVGAVVARGDRVIAVGHHERAGGAHGEVNALRRAGRAARGATLYSTLEPCNHVGKTPPCTEAILRAGIRRVVVGVRDPNPHVPGRGIERLRRGGVRVDIGVLREACLDLIAGFAKVAIAGLPLVTLKAAVSLDGRIATETGDSKWITGEPARREAHRLRAENDAILVGCNTVRADDPDLTVRLAPLRGPPPARVVVCSRGDLSPRSRLARTARRVPTWIAHAPRGRPAATRLIPLGVKTLEVRARSGRVDLRDLLRRLAGNGMLTVLVEGGGDLHASFLESGLADRVVVFIAPRILGGKEAVPMVSGRGVRRVAQAFRLERVRVREVGDDLEVAGILLRGPRRTKR